MLKNLYLYIFSNFVNIKQIIFFICMDYFTAILVAIYENKLSSNIGYKGIIKKIGIIVCISIVLKMDELNLFQENIKVSPIIILFFIFNEIISCFENLNKLKIPMPLILKSLLKKIKEKNK